MAKLKFIPPERRSPEPPAVDEIPLIQARQRSRTNLKDIVWVAIGLVVILAVMAVYQTGHNNERRVAERQAQLRAATATALPPPGYGGNARYPTAGEVEADAAAQEARALITANAADNSADPLLNPQASGAPAMPLPTNPKPFSDPNYAAGGLSQPAAQPAAPAGPPR